VIEKLLLYI